MSAPSPSPLALVLAGGAARGAYEVGVAAYLIEEVAPEVGGSLPFDLLTGTSAGAINACVLAAAADDPRAGVRWLSDAWRELRITDVIHPAPREALAIACGLLGARRSRAGRGGLLRAGWLDGFLGRVPFGRIGEHVRDGRLGGAAVAATHVGTGHTVVFQQRGRAVPADGRVLDVREVDLSAEHAKASAAIPILLPAVPVDGELYCDGGIHQMVPLAPALRLGATRILVVSPRTLGPEVPGEELARERALASPAYLLGKTLDALLVDRIDGDLRELDTINAVIRAGTRRFGPTFAGELNQELATDGRHPLLPRSVAVVRPGRDLGALAADYVRSPDFARRGGAAGRVLRRLADAEGSRETDLISYLLFDGHFADILIAQGRADARARHEELCALVADGRDPAGAQALRQAATQA
jgi:NTE family protein